MNTSKVIENRLADGSWGRHKRWRTVSSRLYKFYSIQNGNQKL